MTADQLREFIRRQPFEPFTIHLADGSNFRLGHPESMYIAPGWSTTAIVGLPKDRFSFIYLKNVTHVSSRGSYPNVVQRRRRDEGSDE